MRQRYYERYLKRGGQKSFEEVTVSELLPPKASQCLTAYRTLLAGRPPYDQGNTGRVLGDVSQ